MSTIAVFAHFDPSGLVAPHVERYLRELSATVDRLTVVSTADLTPQARATIQNHGELVARENVGYDFYSWKVGLDTYEDWSDVDRIVMCNDSVVGPLRPLADVMTEMSSRGVDFWGIVQSREITPHLQSWFVVFERPIVASGLFHGFWRAVTPISDRSQVIRRYEIGLSRLLSTAGFQMAPYFSPGVLDRLKAVRRRRGLDQTDRGWLASIRDPEAIGNPAISCWDAALDGRLPFAKIEVLRDDPYGLGADRMLSQLEKAHPEAFAGVRDYLERTRADVQRLRGRAVSKAN